MADQEPIVKLEPGGRASILSYNVPEPVSYSGTNSIGLEFKDDNGDNIDIFLANAYEIPSRTPVDQMRQVTREEVMRALREGNIKVFPNIQLPLSTTAALFTTQTAIVESGGEVNTATTSLVSHALANGTVRPDLAPLVQTQFLALEGQTNVTTQRLTSLPPAANASALSTPALSDTVTRPALTDLDINHAVEQLHNGKRLNVYRTMWGNFTYNYLPEPERAKPRLVIVEKYRLSSYLGNYGAGRTISTFSLLPGEKTVISVKTFRKSETDRKSTSSILDSFTKESADAFESEVKSERSTKTAETEEFQYHAEAEAEAGWGWGSAKVSGGVKGGTTSAREDFGKDMSSALQKHAAKASSKRDIQVNTSFEVKESTGEETSTVRTIQNINLSRTLNFVFRQMNQEHITLLHLVDVRVAFFNGYGEFTKEVTLPKLDSLLEEFVKPELISTVRNTIVEQLETIFDYKDELVTPSFIQERKISEADSYLRVDKSRYSIYKDETGNEIVVPGIIIRADKSVMRTDGVIVDALLGQGEALDTYSRGLQTEAVIEKSLENAERRAELERKELARKIVVDGDETAAGIYADVFPAAGVVIESGDLSVCIKELNKSRNGTSESVSTLGGS